MGNVINYREIDSLVRNIETKRIIAIDGVDGAGKTYLATKLNETLFMPVLDTDDYLLENNENYLEHLNINNILKYLENKDSFIIHGVCLLEVLEKLNISSYCFIYVKRIDERGDWIDEDECVVDSAEELITKLECRLKVLFPQSKITEFRKEIIRYHSNYKPFNKAIVFERVKN